MCGFFASNSPKVNIEHLDIIKNRIAFRGPDGESSLISHAGWKLYHARLAIIAPNSKYNQPYFTSDGSVILFNGEILNFRTLAKKYGIHNQDSDTHVLSKLLKNKSFKIDELEGFYAFLRIDSAGKLTHCARDKFGVKPLNFYKSKDNTITISSEASAIADIFGMPYNKKAIEEYKVFRSPIFQGSFFTDIHSIKPGTCLINGVFFDSLSCIPEQYKKINEVIDELDKAIRDSIKSRMVSDVPVGLLYSGGIDSNLINEYCENELTRYTGGFAGDYDVEHAKKSESKSIIVNVSNEEFIERFDSMIALRKEPLSVPNEVILSFLAGEWSKSGGKVLISGEAADELFAGYDRIYSWAIQAESFDVKTFLSMYAYVDISNISKEIINDVANFFTELEGLSVFEMVRQFFIKIHLPVLFRRLDFALMYSGVEGREPLASSMMFKVAMDINPKDMFKKNLGKFPLRHLVSKKIDQDFAFKPKVGFPIDLGHIFNNKKTTNRYDNYNIWCQENLRRINL
jgi:asparagine synthase (glutamine-hydrolysing)